MIAVIHRQHVIELLEIIGLNLAATQIAKFYAATESGLLSTGIRWLTDMIGMGAGGVGMNFIGKAGLFNNMPKHTFRSG